MRVGCSKVLNAVPQYSHAQPLYVLTLVNILGHWRMRVGCSKVLNVVPQYSKHTGTLYVGCSKVTLHVGCSKVTGALAYASWCAVCDLWFSSSYRGLVLVTNWGTYLWEFVCSVRFFIQGLNLIDFLAIFPFYMTAIVTASGLSANHTEVCVCRCLCVCVFS
jgi:hypothetical protein